jgi:predicted 2-oxoglutarate/Fe(II)-dependent dioxygenase YbiX
MQIFEFQNFMSKEDCKLITDWFKSQKKTDLNSEALFNNRTIPYSLIDSEEIKRKVNLFRFNATFQAISTFKEALYPDYTDLVYWPIGKSMEVHADSQYQDGSPGKFPWRKISGVLYLNDDYEGGETYFPEQNIKYTPEAGHLIMFPSDLTHPHGVTEVIKGDRYTLPIWFTDDETKLEI